MSGIVEGLKNAVNSLAHPGQADDAVRPLEHPASHGPTSSVTDPNMPVLQKLWSPETTLQIKSQGNNGVGMDDGLRAKAIEQQERVAERSRLRAEGLFEEHTKHEDMVNMSAEHRNVADGAKVDYGN